MQKLAAILILAAAIAVGGASGAGSAAADTSTPSVYTDATGDSATAPDVSKVTLTPGNGTLLVDMAYTGELGADGHLLLLIDADRNSATGTGGMDYMLQEDFDGAYFVKWDGTQWVDFTHVSTGPTLTPTNFTATITLADIGGISTFNFVAAGVRNDDIDWVPDDGAFTFPTAPPPPPAPTVKALLLPSAVFTARAGAVLRLPRLSVQLSDGTTARVSRQTCTLALRGKRLPALAGGCAWRIPKADRGRRLALTVKYVYGGDNRSATWSVFPR